MAKRSLLLLALLGLSACGAFGNLTTGAMQTTNAVAGAPRNGPGDPPSPPREPAL